MTDFRLEELEQEMFILSEKVAALSDRVQRQQPLAGYNMVSESTERGTVIGQAPASGPAAGYRGDFTLVAGASACAVVDLERGMLTEEAGTVYAYGYSSVNVPRLSFPLASGTTTVKLVSTISSGALISELVATQEPITYPSGLYDVVVIGSVWFDPGSGEIYVDQSWRDGSRYIEYRWY